ncbi:DUF3352 domain-containing protein [Oscillatoria sp. CS-180]|uniref:DUF3352 domain-containing protein n=1 Tax=Oscillatoria sp. CS-180 TaxID=3021720 RepID=UPI00232D9A01|nr:DUF3352 domain-containing protein [Oscillatoria sp. CS-180]MDB9529845.1 DUF3352 domain-containing protein [Oscillatoria sp. CS-180]
MKSRTFYSAIALVAGLLIFVGIGGFWGLTMQNPRALLSKGGQEIPEAAQFVPRQAPAMISLLARPDRLWQLRQVLTPSNRRFAAREEWQSLEQALESATGWDYDTDLRPWLDEEVTFAVTTTDLDRDETNGLQAGYLAVLSCRDVEAAREALHVLWQKRAATGRNLVFETVSSVPLIYDRKPTDAVYRGVEALNLENPALQSLASAIVGDRAVLLANDPQVLRQAITTYQAPDISLAKASNYRESIKTLPSKRIGWLYANVPNLLAWLGLEDAGQFNGAVTETPRANFVFVSLRAFSSGLLGDTAIAAAPGKTFEFNRPSTQTATSALSLLPEETLFATSGTNFSQLLEDIDENIGGYSITQRSLQALLSSFSLPGAAPSASLLASLQGEYALGTLPDRPTTWLLVSKSQEEMPFASIDTFAEAQGINVNHVQLDNQDLTTWTRFSISRTSPQSPMQLMTQLVGVHTTIDGYEVLSTSLSGLQQILQSLDGDALSDQPAFTGLIEELGPSKGAFTYINWPDLAPSLLKQFAWLRAIEQAGQPLTSHLGPIVFQANGSSQSLQEGSIAIKLLENS